jgi:hypothetical protein
MKNNKMKNIPIDIVITIAIGFFIFSSFSQADLKPETVHRVENKKTKVYIQDGLFVGGDRAIDQIIVKDIRRAPNVGFERLVIDLDENNANESIHVKRPPYFQVAISPDEKRLVFTLWGHPQFAFNSRKVLAAFKRSQVVERITLFPRLEDEMWSFVLELKNGKKAVEVFELSNPVRIIVDIKSNYGGRR